MCGCLLLRRRRLGLACGMPARAHSARRPNPDTVMPFEASAFNLCCNQTSHAVSWRQQPGHADLIYGACCMGASLAASPGASVPGAWAAQAMPQKGPADCSCAAMMCYALQGQSMQAVQGSSDMSVACRWAVLQFLPRTRTTVEGGRAKDRNGAKIQVAAYHGMPTMACRYSYAQRSRPR